MIMRKYVIVTCLIVFVISTVFCFEEKTEVRAKEKPLVLVLDRDMEAVSPGRQGIMKRWRKRI